MGRHAEIELVTHNNPERRHLLGNNLVKEQDGLYLQAVYGFAPRWRFGVRGEAIGLTNREKKPSGLEEKFDPSWRGSAMLDWTLTEFSRLRLQGNHSRYDTDEGKENVSEVFLQAVFSLGAHPAHRLLIRNCFLPVPDGRPGSEVKKGLRRSLSLKPDLKASGKP